MAERYGWAGSYGSGGGEEKVGGIYLSIGFAVSASQYWLRSIVIITG